MRKPAVMAAIQFVVMLILVFGGHGAAAQGASRISVGVVDIQKILNESLAAQSVRKQVEAMSKKFGADARKARDGLRNEERDLAGKRAILSPERFAQMRRELGQKATNRQRSLNNRRRGIDRSLSSAMGKVQKVFREVSAEIAKERKLTMVLRKSAVVLSPVSMDITKEVLNRLNQRLPKVAVVQPK